MKAKIHIGTQGWNYDGWIGPFYPRGTTQKEMLTLYAKIFDTVEIDSTFYAVPAESAVRGWAARTPADFTFSLKLPSEITHKNRLRDSEGVLFQFIERVCLLKEKLGCILIQLPPDFSPNERPALKSFLRLLPKDLRFAVEFRDRGWINEATLDDLGESKVALTLTDSRWISREQSFAVIEHPTAQFTYVRWLGPRELTDVSRVQVDRSKEMAQWAEAFGILTRNVPVIYGYFNNHFQGHSPASCNDFKRRIGLPTVAADHLIIQPSLF